MTLFKGLKQSTLVNPLLPKLRTIRRKVTEIQLYPEYLLEHQKSQKWSRNFQPKLYTHIETAIKSVKNDGGFFGGFAASEAALRAFTQLVFELHSHPTIVEFGSGQSTRFFGHLMRMIPAQNFAVHTFEHHPFWVSQAQKIHPKLNVHSAKLLQVSDAVKENMFVNLNQSLDVFLNEGEVLPENRWDETRVPNTFYATPFKNIFESQSIHGLVLDGPNGSGRSLCFPLLFSYLKPNAIVLIDDYDHYPFIDDLKRVFSFEILHQSHALKKSWCLLRLSGPKNQ